MTDVEDLHQWIVKHMTEHPLFERISAEEEVCRLAFNIDPFMIYLKFTFCFRPMIPLHQSCIKAARRVLKLFATKVHIS